MPPDPAGRLSEAELAVLRVLMGNPGRVLGRQSLSRLAGLQDSHARRCDSALVTIRRVLGPGSVLTVRRRGWMLSEQGLAVAMDLFGVHSPDSGGS